MKPHVVIFHHALGLTPGVMAFAEEIRSAGYAVTTPDLFDGQRFEDITQGVAHAEMIGFETIIQRGVDAASDIDQPIVVVGFSLGALPAQKLAQSDDRVRGAVLCHSAIAMGMFSDTWPAGVALQMHLVEHDALAEEDLAAAHELAATVAGAELYLYPGHGHLVAEPGHRDYDGEIASAIMRRTQELLSHVREHAARSP